MPTNRRNQRRTRRGFTLLEIMAVVVIIGLLVGVGGFAVIRQMKTAQVGTARAQISEIASAIKTYQMENGSRLPETLEVLVAAERREDRLLDRNDIPLDPWGNPYIFQTRSDKSWAVISLGADGAPGGEGFDADIADSDKKPEEFLTGGY